MFSNSCAGDYRHEGIYKISFYIYPIIRIKLPPAVRTCSVKSEEKNYVFIYVRHFYTRYIEYWKSAFYTILFGILREVWNKKEEIKWEENNVFMRVSWSLVNRVGECLSSSCSKAGLYSRSTLYFFFICLMFVLFYRTY